MLLCCCHFIPSNNNLHRYTFIFLGSCQFLLLLGRLLNIIERPSNDFVDIYEMFSEQNALESYFVALPPRHEGYGLIGIVPRNVSF